MPPIENALKYTGVILSNIHIVTTNIYFFCNGVCFQSMRLDLISGLSVGTESFIWVCWVENELVLLIRITSDIAMSIEDDPAWVMTKLVLVQVLGY